MSFVRWSDRWFLKIKTINILFEFLNILKRSFAQRLTIIWLTIRFYNNIKCSIVIVLKISKLQQKLRADRPFIVRNNGLFYGVRVIFANLCFHYETQRASKGWKPLCQALVILVSRYHFLWRSSLIAVSTLSRAIPTLLHSFCGSTIWYIFGQIFNT